MLLVVYAGSGEDLISENDHHRSLLKHEEPTLTLYIRNKKENTNKLCEFSKDLYSNNLLVTCLGVSMAIRLS